MASSTCSICGAETRLLPNTTRPLADVASYMEWRCVADPTHVFEDANTRAHTQTRSFGDHART
jgi:hypothetical protein